METQQFINSVKQQAPSTTEPLNTIGLKHWSVDEGHNVLYQNNDFHTLSFYLNGGTKNVRVDRPSLKGGAGRFCFMPQAQDSVWQIKEKTEFAHLYFNQQLINRFAATTYQMDTRFIELTDQVFLQDEQLQALFLRYFKARQSSAIGGKLVAEQLCYQILDKVIGQFNGFESKQPDITSGLSPTHRKQIHQQVIERLGDKLTVADLAKSINLSPFHFAKMFKLSFGESPASFINWVRIEKSKALLKSKASLADISLQLGFTHQSHMTQSFKRVLGVTPARYRKLVSG